MFFKRLISFLSVIILIGCNENTDQVDPSIIDENNGEIDENSWIIPLTELTGSDNPFPYAAMPAMFSVAEVQDLSDDDQVILVSFGAAIKAYPLKFIAPFEVINDELEGVSFGISLCPVTESALCTENKQEERYTSQVASGYRYNQNIIVKDLNSNSYWSQMLIKYVKGPYVTQSPKTLPMIETKWGVVKTYFPEALVFTSNSISSKTVNTNEKSSEFGIDERIYGVLNENEIDGTVASVVGFSSFDQTIKSYNQIFDAEKIEVFGSQKYHFITAFRTEISNSFSPIQNKFPLIMKDASGSEYNIFGIAVNGPNAGHQLSAPKSYFASWWAWQEFYSNFQNF